ncbi:MAG: phosphatase PAP2 family protein [Candidatus Delongbacteria bacterium]
MAEYSALAGVSGLGIVLYNNDSYINGKFISNRNSFNDNISASAKLFGDKYILAGGFVSLYALSEAFENHKLKKTSVLGLKSMAVSGIITYSLKLLTHRKRPRSSSDPYEFSGPSFSTKDLSFPSGHTTLAFSAAKIINGSYSDIKYLPCLTYSAAVLTGLSRIYDNEHWASDVLAGAIIGYFSAAIVSKNSDQNSVQNIYPLISGDRIGLFASYSF